MRDDDMTDARLDDEIARALAVDPSPQLAARIRQRVATEQLARGWTASWLPWTRWMPWAAAVSSVAAAALVALGFAWHGSATRRAVPSLAGHAIVSRGVAIPDIRPGGGRHALDGAVAPGSVWLQRRARLNATAEPEILVDPREARAIRAFIDRASTGRIDVTASVDPSARAVMDAEPIRDIHIAPIDMSPLTGGEQGVTR